MRKTGGGGIPGGRAGEGFGARLPGMVLGLRLWWDVPLHLTCRVFLRASPSSTSSLLLYFKFACAPWRKQPSARPHELGVDGREHDELNVAGGDALGNQGVALVAEPRDPLAKGQVAGSICQGVSGF